MFDLHHPFFIPLWRRVLTVAVAASWTLIELLSGASGWALLAAAMTAWAIWGLFIAWDPEFETSPDPGTSYGPLGPEETGGPEETEAPEETGKRKDDDG